MRILKFSAFLLIFVLACSSVKQEDNEKKSTENIEMMKDTTPKVTGIGGIFFKTKDPAATKNWYSENLGMVTDEYGTMFKSRNIDRPDEVNYLQWSPFNNKTDYFNPSEKEFMVNYRVQNLEGLVKKLKENGVNILDEIEEYDYGKFVHIMDPDGNKIELWEPEDSTFDSSEGENSK